MLEQLSTRHAHQKPGVILNEFLPRDVVEKLCRTTMVVSVVLESEPRVRPRQVDIERTTRSDDPVIQ